MMYEPYKGRCRGTARRRRGCLFALLKLLFVLAVLIALVDALPMLGTGTVLIPWAVYALIRGEQALAIGLGALYGVVVLLRSTLEPRLIGRQLGLSPLVTLGALYVGYRLWGVLGMILAPVLVITAGELLAMAKGEKGVASS